MKQLLEIQEGEGIKIDEMIQGKNKIKICDEVFVWSFMWNTGQVTRCYILF